ncbi:ABC transporter substrate-binding protein [Dictyoglomus thermophilum]|uniref:Oligopeptide ABC transporter, periplasmic oligopeptide-binding protein n=1 Tax=Dictyoglomus thermophilum (strain ATCC 35947 / DSM 3960 / H-6-12) TaxID=309799 RepID=B5YAD9_DICT6|nr:ABC transporter substrate-binding protein [Dictyoglomus thermophilum]ACI20044.1 oligopeptide ABC transporter, periplasmic oligopeptide-binding protein [Dictyoglomus thermophilum H-6-12]
MKCFKFLSILLIFILIFGNTIVGQKKYNESPMTAALVKEGKLPPVEQRLPKNPIVVKPLEEVGVYGGTLRRAWMGPGDRWGIAKICYDANNLMRWASDSKTILPWLVEKYTISKDGRVFTFKLREGLKWSDGQPMTTDDVIFWYEDVIGNEELTPTFPSAFVQDGVRAKFVKVDNYTFRIEFKNPNPMFIYTFPTQGWFIDNSKGSFAFYAPKHYLMQFHPKYTPKDKLEALAKQKGFNKWYELFQFMIDYIQNPDLPTMSPWKIVSKSPNEPAFVMERNPYYPVVDTEGNQLPYIDRVVHYLVSDAEMINMKAVAGEIDFQARHMRLPNYTLFMQNKEKGNYRILVWRTGTGADPAIYLNQNVKDPVKRKLFQDVRFRQALSLAINREEINKILFFGLGVPMQAAIPPGSAYYDKAWAQAYAQYDPGRAKILLDAMGLKVGKDGFRIGPDGKPIELVVSFTTYPGSANMSTMELIKSYWEAIGIKTIIKQVDRSLYTTQCNSGDIEIGVWVLDRMSNVAISPGRLLGTWTDGPWAPLYARWYWTKGQEGEEPTGDIRKIYDLWDEFNRTVDARRRDTIIRQIIALHRKNIWIIGTVGGIPQLVIVNNKLRNVPDGILWDDPFRSELNSFPEQFFFKQ